MRKILLIICVFTLFSALNLNATERTVGIAQAVAGTSSSSLGAETITGATNVTVTKITGSSGDTLTNLTNVVGSSPKAVKYDGENRYPEKLYKYNKSSTVFSPVRYCGFSVAIGSGYKISLSNLAIELATTANFTWKVVIEQPAGTVLYTSDAMTISNYDKAKNDSKAPITNNSLDVDLSENDDVQNLEGTFYVKVYPYYSSTGKYFCFPSFTITGEVEEKASCTSITPSLSYASVGGTTLAIGGSSSGSPTVGGNTGSGAVTYAITTATPSGCATVDEDGIVTGVHAGTATVTATVAAASTYCSGTATANFTISCNSITPTFSSDYTSTTLTVGGDNSSTPVINKNGSSGAITWESSDKDVATVNSSGVVTPVASGSATITATVAANGDYCEGSVSKNFTINAAACSPSISASPSSANYCKDDVATALSFTGSGHNAQKWQKSTDGGDSWSDIDGATNATFTPSTSATGSTQYRVVTTCDSYTTTATSSAATVTVKTSPNLTISLDE